MLCFSCVDRSKCFNTYSGPIKNSYCINVGALLRAVALSGSRFIWGRSQLFHQHERLALPVIEAAAIFRQVVDRSLHKAAFQEPVFGARRQHENACESARAGALLDALEQPLPVAGALRF